MKNAKIKKYKGVSYMDVKHYYSPQGEEILYMNEVKSNFFKSNVSNYAKSSIDLNDF